MKVVELQAFYLSEGHDFRGHHGGPRGNHGIVQPSEIECVAGKGIVGDRYFGYKEDFKGQITFFDQAVLDALQKSGLAGDQEIEAWKLRRNVLIAGYDILHLINKDFRIGEVEFYGMEQCAPCYWMDEAVAPGTEDFLQGRGGLRAKITKSGKLALGEHELTFL